MSNITIFSAPLSKGEPGFDGGHVSDITDKRETLWSRGEWSGLFLGQQLVDEVETSTCETQVQPCDAIEHGVRSDECKCKRREEIELEIRMT